MNKPEKRENCINGQRPCPYVSCKWHVIHAYNPAWVARATDDQVVELLKALPDTCILDVCDRGGVSGYRALGVLIGMSHMGAGKMLKRASGKVMKSKDVLGYG